MTKTELVALVAEKTGLTKKDSEKAVKATFEAVTEALVKGEKVQVVGFGSFEANIMTGTSTIAVKAAT